MEKLCPQCDSPMAVDWGKPGSVRGGTDLGADPQRLWMRCGACGHVHKEACVKGEDRWYAEAMTCPRCSGSFINERWVFLRVGGPPRITCPECAGQVRKPPILRSGFSGEFFHGMDPDAALPVFPPQMRQEKGRPPGRMGSRRHVRTSKWKHKLP